MKTVPLGLRLFMEGIEVPIISAQVNCAPSQPASAAIQIIPTDAALDLLPRTLVHLFSLDPELRGEDLAYYEQLSDNKIPNREVLNRVEAQDTQYKLIFTGEVIGYQFVKSPTERQIALQCMDHSVYWDLCYQWYADYSVSGDALTDKAHNFVGAGQGLFDSVARGTKWVISQLLNSRPKTPQYRNISGLLGGLIHLLEAVGGVRPDRLGKNGYGGVNEYFTIAELRYNLLGMVGAVPEDTTSTRIYAAKAFRDWLRNGMSSLGNLISFRDIIRHVGRYVFHDIYPNPAPYYAQPGTAKVNGWTSIYSETPSGSLAVSSMIKAKGKLEKAYDLFWAILARAEVELTVEEARGGLLAAPVSLADTNVPAGIKQLDEAASDIKSASTSLRGLKTPDAGRARTLIQEVSTEISAARKEAAEVRGSGDALRYLQRGMKKILKHIGGPSPAEKDIYTAGALKPLIELLGPMRRSDVRRRKTTVKVETGAHLYSQLVLPETFFVAPPRCNVLFPDQVYNFSYGRNFMREVTRLSCQSGLGLIAGRRGAKLLGRNYFAPSIRDAKGRTLYATLGYGHRILLPHEIHSGIIPKFEWVSSGHRWGVKAAKERNFKDEFYQAGKVGYIQRLAHFQFFLHRWASRTMSAQCVFNPNLVIGFPGLVIDKGLPPEAVRKALQDELQKEILPTQYLGKVYSYTHNLTQAGGMTSVNFTHCRTHRGTDDEFLGVLLREKIKSRTETYKIFPAYLAKEPGRYGPRGLAILRNYFQGYLKKGFNLGSGSYGGVVARVDVSPTIVRIASGLAKNIGVDKSDIQIETQQLPEEATAVQRAKVTASYGAGGSYADVPEWIAVTVYRYRKTGELVRSGLAVEDALMPGWYSEVWAKDKISEKVYRPLLGTRAITDDAPVYEDTLAELVTEHKVSERRQARANRFVGSGQDPSNDVGGSDMVVDRVGSAKDGGDEFSKLNVPVDSLEKAIDGLVYIYSVYKQRGLDVHEFISNYTTRPIANMVQILGSQNLTFKNGEVADPTTMTEGFHSRAFGEYNADVRVSPDGKIEAGTNALGDLPKGELKPLIPRGKKQRRVEIPPYLDPRGRAQARVLEYVKELQASRGISGV